MIIRQATEADLVKINELIRQQENQFLKEQTLESLKDPWNISLIAEQDEIKNKRIVAFGQARQIEREEGNRQSGKLIKTVFVSDKQVKGLDAQFIAEWLMEAKKRKIRTVDLNGF